MKVGNSVRNAILFIAILIFSGLHSGVKARITDELVRNTAVRDLFNFKSIFSSFQYSRNVRSVRSVIALVKECAGYTGDSNEVTDFIDDTNKVTVYNCMQDKSSFEGPMADARHLGSIALGRFAMSTSLDSVAIGKSSSSSDANTVAIGTGAWARQKLATALGAGSRAFGRGSLAASGANSTGGHSIAMGSLAEAEGHRSIAIGVRSKANGLDTMALLGGTTSSVTRAIAIGKSSHAGSDDSIAFGSGVIANGHGAVAIGNNFTNNKENSLAIGFNDQTKFFVNAENGVGINTTAPQADLDVNGDLKASKINSGQIKSFITDSVITNSKGGTFESLNVGRLNVNGTLAATEKVYAQELEVYGDSRLNTVSTTDLKVDGNVEVSEGIRVHELDAHTLEAGINATAKGEGSIALGPFAQANGDGSVAMGLFSKSIAPHSIAIGVAHTRAPGAIAIGSRITAEAQGSMVMGDDIKNDQENSLLVGFEGKDAIFAQTVEENGIVDRRKEEQLKRDITRLESRIARYQNIVDRYRDRSWITRYIDRLEGAQEEVANLQQQLIDLSKDIVEARVGIGTRVPKRTLHVEGAMRLASLKEPPHNAAGGDLYYNESGALCVFIQGSSNGYWSRIAGIGFCN